MSFRDTLIAPLMIDGYKLFHRSAYHEDEVYQYNNYTNRFGKYSQSKLGYTIVAGIRPWIHDYIVNDWGRFFRMDKNYVVEEYRRVVANYLHIAPETVYTQHISDLHDLGYLPLRIKALPEGSKVPYGVPCITIENTHPDFAWLTGLIETHSSAEIWLNQVAASIAYAFRKRMEEETCIPHDLIKFLGHDFAYRGMEGLDGTLKEGIGHLFSFVGTDNIPAGLYSEYVYDSNIEKELVFASVNATEHSCEMSNILINMHHQSDEIKESMTREQRMLLAEKDYIEKLLTRIAPTGVLSYVSDGNDFWSVVTKLLPRLKDTIMNRDGKLVIRPDCYSEDTKILTPSGWKFFKDLNENDLVAQVHDDGHYDFVKPSKYIEQFYNGDMHHFHDHHGKLDILVTPNHRMVIQQNGIETIRFAESLPHNGYSGQKMARGAKAISNPNKTLTLKERLNIAFQADGSYTTTGNKIRFSFSKDRKKERLISILNDMGVNYKIYDLSDGRVEFNINVNALEYYKNFDWVDTSNLTYEWCVDFIEELTHWDSSIRSENRFKFDTTNISVIKVVELVAISAGYGCLISKKEDNRKDIFNDVYTANILENNLLGGQSWENDIVQYSGKIYCVTVPTGKLLVKRNRCTVVCGNSGVPEDIICGTNTKALTIKKGAYNSFEEWKECVQDDLDERFRDELAEDCTNPFFDMTEVYNYEGYNYEVTYEPDLNRHDKTYYYVDNWGNYAEKFKWNLLEEKPESKGLIQCLYEIFGGTEDENGLIILDSHIGAIYGDSISLERQDTIYKRLKAKGFNPCNIILGVGSYSYQYNTRDSEGSAVKCTNITLRDGTEIALRKDPKTDHSKKSAFGLMKVIQEGDTYKLLENVSRAEEMSEDNELKVVFLDGECYNLDSLATIRKRLWGENF